MHHKIGQDKSMACKEIQAWAWQTDQGQQLVEGTCTLVIPSIVSCLPGQE